MKEKEGHLSVTPILLALALVFFFFFYFFLEKELLKTSSLVLLIITFLSLLSYLFWRFVYFSHQFKKKLALSPNLSIKNSKKNYLSLYQIYLKLPSYQKGPLYHQLTHLREKIESQLKAQNRIQEILTNLPTNLKKKKQVYLEFQSLYHKLSPPDQEKYYSRLSHLRDQLENHQ